MELSDCKIKKFLIFLEMQLCTFQHKLEKIKKKSTPGKFLYSGKMELSNSNIKNFFHFLKRKLFLYFSKWKPPKKSLYFLKRKLF